MNNLEESSVHLNTSIKTSTILKNTQHVAYQTLVHGFKNKQLSHAYLISGDVGTPLLETALFLAQSLVCEHQLNSELACEECVTCLRIENQSYLDFVLIDGSQASIKKDEIGDIQYSFSKSPVEIAGKKVYVIHLMEKASIAAMNSILKFLEEPVEDVTAIITTQNLNKILPTIVSRCQSIRLKSSSKKSISQLLMTQGYDEEDAKLMSLLIHDVNEIGKETQEEYRRIKDAVFDVVSVFAKQFDDALFYVQRHVSNNLDKKSASLFLLILEIVFKDMLKLDGNQDLIFESKREEYGILKEKIKNPLEKIKCIMLASSDLDYNANIALAFDKLMINLMK